MNILSSEFYITYKNSLRFTVTKVFLINNELSNCKCKRYWCFVLLELVLVPKDFVKF